MDQKQRTEALAQCVRRLEERHLREVRPRIATALSQAIEEGDDPSQVIEELHKQDERLREIHSTRVRRGF